MLGLKYVGCAWIPHDDSKPFDEKTCRDAIAVFNHAGEVLAQHGLKFFYHVHGYEFQPYGDGTLLDLLIRETNPKYVNYEMDVFWIVHPGQDPVKLLKKYGHRWQLMHLKGMRDSTPTGLLTGHSAVTNDVALGTGKIDYVPILKEAKKLGIKWYIIEDESPLSEQQVPQSYHYLQNDSNGDDRFPTAMKKNGWLALAIFVTGRELGCQRRPNWEFFPSRRTSAASQTRLGWNFDPAKGEYLVAGGGENMWFTNDAFHFVWKKMSGDFTLTANVRFVGTNGNAHRKACLFVRQIARCRFGLRGYRASRQRAGLASIPRNSRRTDA